MLEMVSLNQFYQISFEPFQSGKAGSGVGIGLNIAKEIIETHSGTIKAYNEDNQAVFEVIL